MRPSAINILAMTSQKHETTDSKMNFRIVIRDWYAREKFSDKPNFFPLSSDLAIFNLKNICKIVVQFTVG